MIITLYKFTIDTDIDIYTDNLWDTATGRDRYGSYPEYKIRITWSPGPGGVGELICLCAVRNVFLVFG